MRRTISLVMVAIVIASSFGVVFAVRSGTDGVMYVTSTQVNSLSSHSPIRIDNDSDFADTAASDGWKGNGSADNPYIIENYDINGTDAGYCIYIGNTTAHFVIRNCSVHDASGNSWTYYWNSGIVLYEANNGVINNNTAFSNSGSGIYLFISDFVVKDIWS